MYKDNFILHSNIKSKSKFKFKFKGLKKIKPKKHKEIETSSTTLGSLYDDLFSKLLS